MKKKGIIGIGIIGVVIVVFFIFQGMKPAKTEETIKVVSVYEVEKQTPLHLKGQVQSKEIQTVLLNAEKGPIKTIHYQIGDHVPKDAVLVTYEWGEKIKAERESIIASLNEDAKNDFTKPLMVLNSVDTEIKGTVTEYDKEKLSNEMPITIDYISQNKSVEGKIVSVSEINNTTDTAANTNTSTSNIVNYDFTAQPNEAIPLGYSVEILIPRNEIHIPTKSVQKKEDKFYVYTVEKEKAKLKEVSVKEEEGYYLLESGIDEGTKIIKNVENVKDGMEVTIQ